MRLSSWWLWSIALAGAPAAPPLKLDLPVPQVVAAGGCYPSGLQVVAVSRPGTGLATAVWAVDGGQAQDPDGQGGAMHLVEHLWFRSHPERGEELRQAAWQLEPHAETHVDTTVYWATSSVADLAAMIKLHAWVIAAPLSGVDAATFEAERAVVLHEAWTRGAHADHAALRALDRVLYPADHPYHASLASPEEIAALTLDQVGAVAVAEYVPDGATLYVEADLPPEAILEAVRAALPSRLQAGTGSSCDRAVTPRVPAAVTSPLPIQIEGPRYRPVLMLGWALPPLTAQQEAVVQLAAAQLERHIYDDLVHVPGLGQALSTQAVSCGHTYGRLSSQFTCQVEFPDGVDAGAVHKVIKGSLVDAGSEAANQDGYGLELLSDTASALRTDWLTASERQDQEAVLERGLHAHHTGSVDLFADRVVGLASTGPAEVAAFVQRWFTAERMAAVLVKPGRGPALDLQKISGEASLHAPQRSWNPPEVRPPLSARTLPNGAQSWVMQRGNGPVGLADAVFGAGSMRDPEPGTNEVLDYLAVYSMPGVAFDDLHDHLGMQVFHDFGTWTNDFRARGAAGNLDAALWALRAMAEGQTWDIGERHNALDRSAAYTFSRYPNLPEVFVPAMARSRLFGAHRAGLSWWEQNLAARQVRDDRILQWRNRVLQPTNATVVVVSPRPAAEVDPLVDKYLAKYGGRGKDDPPPATTDALPPAPERSALAVEAPTIASVASATCRVPGIGPDTLATSRVALAALDRALFESLRSQGGSYSPTVELDPLAPEVGVLTLRAEVGPRDAGNAVRGMLAVLGALAGPDQAAFVAAAGRKARSEWGASWSSASSAHATLALGATWGVPPDRLLALDAELAAVTAQDVSAWLADCAGHEVVWVIGSNATDQLATAGLKAETVDWRAARDRVLEAME